MVMINLVKGTPPHSTATPVPLTQDNSDDINNTDKVAQHIKDHFSNDPECDMFDLRTQLGEQSSDFAFKMED
jgi:hypothetical protein